MKHKRTLGDYVFDFIIYLVMLVVFVVSLYPFWYVVMYSFRYLGQRRLESAALSKGLQCGFLSAADVGG